MAFVPLDGDDLATLKIKSFDPETGTLGTGFIFQKSFISDDGLLNRRQYVPTLINTPYPFIYTSSQGVAVTGGTDYPAYILEKDV